MATSQRELKRQLRALGAQLSVTDKKRSQQTRDRVLAFVESSPVKSKSTAYQQLRLTGKFFMPAGVWHYALQPVMVVVLAFTLVTGGWVTSVSAASNSLPGDALYTVKLVSEKTQLRLAYWSDDPLVVTGLQVSFAKRRINEIQAVSELTDEDKQERIGKAVAGFKKGIAAVRASLVQTVEEQPEQVAAIAKEIKEQGTDLVEAIERAEGTVSQEVALELADAKNVVEDATDEAVQAIVVSQQDGLELVSEEDIAQVIVEKLERATVSAQPQEAQLSQKTVQKHLEEGEFEQALDEVKRVRALVKEQTAREEEEKLELPNLLIRVIENVTSTIIGE